MGRFGISFSDESGKGFKIDRKKYFATINHDENGEGTFQRCLAWLSYIIMVLTAFVTFNTPARAGVADHVTLVERQQYKPTISSSAPSVSGLQVNWTLRKTR